MNYGVIIQPDAQREIEESYAWLIPRSPQNAPRWLDGLNQAVQSLQQLPQRCPLAPENDAFDYEVRQLLYGKRPGVYRILFTIHEDFVHILHIRHAARKFLDETESS